MQPSIQTIEEIKIVGKKLTMSYAQNETFKLFQSFMPVRNQIPDVLNDEIISMQIFPAHINFEIFDIHTSFDKWAAKAVDNFNTVPENMETFTIPSGMYAIFHYKGNSNNAMAVFPYIFSEWLPNSIYKLDNRPHFEVLGNKYKNNDENSEEDIYIPIQLKQ
jgi:AraC family transcriptional regulator